MQTFPFKPLKVLSHKATCHCDMSPQQNHIYMTLMQLDTATLLQWVTDQDGVAGKACDWFIYTLVTATCHTCMSHEGTNSVHLWHFVVTTCHKNSNWFEFIQQVIQQVTASNCIRTDMSHEATFPRARLRGCVIVTGHLLWQDLKPHHAIHKAVVRICATFQIPSVTESEDREVWSCTPSHTNLCEC